MPTARKRSWQAKRTAARAASAARLARQASWDVAAAPFVVVWELTVADRACDDVSELSTHEALEVVADIARSGPVILVLTGDVMARPDVDQIVAAASTSGLRVALAPTTTAGVTRRRLRELRGVGVRRMALTLDGPSADVHDESFGTGSFARTLRIAAVLGEEGIALQVNTSLTRSVLGSLGEMADMVARLDAVQWSIVPLVLSRGADDREMLTPGELEAVYNRIYDLARSAPFDIKVTQAPAYRRVAVQRARRDAEASALAAGWLMSAGDTLMFAAIDPDTAGTPGRRFADELDRPTFAIGDGKGFMFISHTGDVSPSSSPTLAAGNVRERSAIEIYREASLFRDLREPSRLKGRCGCCGFREVCGGSRARAYVATGDLFAQDPSCAGVTGG